MPIVIDEPTLKAMLDGDEKRVPYYLTLALNNDRSYGAQFYDGLRDDVVANKNGSTPLEALQRLLAAAKGMVE